MNVLASYKEILKYAKTSATPDELATELSLRALSVEAVEPLAAKFAGMVIGVIEEIKPHPNAQKLQMAITNIGSSVVQIVCGGTNIAKGQKVFVALPGSKVRWHGEGDLVELALTDIRGTASHGMICAPSEVGFPSVACGEKEIWDLTTLTDATAGTSMVEALSLDDTVFDIEVTSNRPDAMGIEGLAREVAASLRADFVLPAYELPRFGDASFTVRVDEPKLCPRYMAVKMTGVKNGPSPWWMQRALLLAGLTPIHAAVDITNYVRLEMAQPLHVFDATHVQGDLSVRRASKGERMRGLDKKDYILSASNLVIADSEGAVAIAGVMGGERTAAQMETTEIIFEAATFEPVSIRRTARALHINSDAQLLYEKGLSTEALPRALARAIQLAQEILGATVASQLVDVCKTPYTAQTYPVLAKRIRARLGVEISDEEILSLLERLGFALERKGSRVLATVPYWRDHDIEAEIDLTEEVARLYGYHLMPRTLPSSSAPDHLDDPEVVWESELKRLLAQADYDEFFGYSFIEGKDLERYGMSPNEAVKIHNPLSDELQYLRTSLIPGALRDIERNQSTTPAASIFEVSRVYKKHVNAELPDEPLTVLVGEYGPDDTELALRRLKGALEYLGTSIGIVFSLEREKDDARWHPSRGARIVAHLSGEEKTVGVFGQVSDEIQKAYGIERSVALLSLDISPLLPHLRRLRAYTPLPEYPVSRRDVAYLVDHRVLFEGLDEVASEATPLLLQLGLVEVYQGKGIPEGKKSVTLSFTFGAADRTLTADEVRDAQQAIAEALSAKHGAQVR